ncbi:MAG: Holliday junction branch migration protein RuvA [Holosporales bacterium]|jgi:Holliday junction DNA helicase RuvA|nr:Holliday junction branch migration protein RuvA [Holosporales bacterium]
MIAKLYGTVNAILEDRLLIQVNGVCYGILCADNTIKSVNEGQEIVLWIEHIIRAETQMLCGFFTYEEQLLFRIITSVRGVGTKIGLAIISVMKPKEIVSAIVNQNKSAFVNIDGVGDKMAERIIVELKNSKHIKSLYQLFGVIQKTNEDVVEMSKLSDAIEALVALGYDYIKAQKAIIEVSTKCINSTSQDLVKSALTKLSI